MALRTEGVVKVSYPGWQGGNPDPTSPGISGGLPVRRPDQRYRPPPAGTAPGQQSNVGRFRLVIISGTAGGLFLYNGTPAAGNAPIASLTTAATDPYGNTVTPSLSLSGMPLLVYSGAPANGNLIASMAPAAGTDEFGNNYIEGFDFSVGAVPGSLINAGTITTTQISATAGILGSQLAALAGITAGQVSFTATGIGGITTYIQGTAPSGSINAGSLWIDTSAGNAIYQYAAGAWTLYQFGSGSIAASSISAAQIVANTITATQIAAGTILGSNIAAGTITASNILANTITASQLAAGIVYAGIVNGTLILGAQLVADEASGPGDGLFVYSGTPALGNLPILSVTGSNEDPYGNTVTPSLSLATLPALFYSSVPAAGNLTTAISGTGGTDEQGNTYPQGVSVGSSASGQSNVQIQPDFDQPITVTAALSALIEAASTFAPADTSSQYPGLIASMVLGSGSTAKEAMIWMSPFANGSTTTAAAIILQSMNDAASDTSSILFCQVNNPEANTWTATPIMALLPYAQILYNTAGGVTVTTVTGNTSGTVSGNISIPAGVTVAKAEAWGPASGGGGAQTGGAGYQGGNGGPGSEYAAEPSLVVPSGGTVAYSIPAAGLGGTVGNAGTAPSGNTTLTGSAVTVTAHAPLTGGQAGYGDTEQAGGTGSTNTVHYNGGGGGNQSPTSPTEHGQGGGSSAGTGQAGTYPGQTVRAGGLAPAGGGNGGEGGGGGGSTGPGNAGQAPGGGGGGGGSNSSGGNSGAAGAPGRVRLTYSTGAPGIMASFASAAGTDQFGNAYLAGTILPGPADTNQYNSGPLSLTNASAVPITSTTPTTIFTINDVAANTTYRIHGVISGTNGASGTLQPQTMRVNGTLTATALRLQVRSAQEGSVTSAAALGQITALNTDASTARTPALGEIFTIEFDGVLVVDTAGTLLIQGRCETSGSDVTWSANAYSFVDLTPVIAATG
jgi:hypothetical protein